MSYFQASCDALLAIPINYIHSARANYERYGNVALLHSFGYGYLVNVIILIYFFCKHSSHMNRG